MCGGGGASAGFYGMLKLARNAFSDLKVFYDRDGEAIEWKFIESLHNEQIGEGLKFGNYLKSTNECGRKDCRTK